MRKARHVGSDHLRAFGRLTKQFDAAIAQFAITVSAQVLQGSQVEFAGRYLPRFECFDKRLGPFASRQ